MQKFQGGGGGYFETNKKSTVLFVSLSKTFISYFKVISFQDTLDILKYVSSFNATNSVSIDTL